MDSMRVDAANNNSAPETLKELLLKSASLERALCRMCATREFTHPTSGQVARLYSFDLGKTMEHFAGKYEKIKQHLAQKYIRENKGFILRNKSGVQQRRAVIKQEPKQLANAPQMKAESIGVKTESSVKQEQMTMVDGIDPAEYESQFEVMAMGIVADELPQTCVEPFLKYIKEHHQGST